MACKRVRGSGWYCVRPHDHDGPCGLQPRWWNLLWRWRLRG